MFISANQYWVCEKFLLALNGCRIMVSHKKENKVWNEVCISNLSKPGTLAIKLENLERMMAPKKWTSGICNTVGTWTYFDNDGLGHLAFAAISVLVLGRTAESFWNDHSRGGGEGQDPEKAPIECYMTITKLPLPRLYIGRPNAEESKRRSRDLTHLRLWSRLTRPIARSPRFPQFSHWLS